MCTCIIFIIYLFCCVCLLNWVSLTSRVKLTDMNVPFDRLIAWYDIVILYWILYTRTYIHIFCCFQNDPSIKLCLDMNIYRYELNRKIIFLFLESCEYYYVSLSNVLKFSKVIYSFLTPIKMLFFIQWWKQKCLCFS